MARRTPRVWLLFGGSATRAEVEIPAQADRGIRLDSPAWVEWLEQPTTLSFAYPIYDSQMGYIRGWMTVRKERRVRGSHYWVAYRRSGGRLRKIYLGQSGQLTQRQLAVTADRFLTMHTPAGDIPKEAMPGQVGGASLEWEAMMRRVKSRQQVVHFGRR
jgi:hypothetical protein